MGLFCCGGNERWPGRTEVMTDEVLKVYTLTPEEIEALLVTDFGGKVQPVDTAKLSRLKQQRANMSAYKTRFTKRKT